MPRRQRLVLAALLLLVSMTGGLWLEGFANHTDDGCPTEVHCLACRIAFVSAGIGASLPAPAPLLVLAGSVVLPVATPEPEVLPSGRSSRGPPLSS